MSHQRRSGRVDSDTVFKVFGAIAILIGVVLTVGVIALTVPFGGFVSTTPATVGTVLFTVLLVGVGYAAYSLRRRRPPVE
ncbi:hypothetical protein [Halorubrum sp. DTA98]|uniref:hypothetical protein n=1 Tax=Halorubrum sp. DTA98 TaxID=3402163 RepID=UPI003AADD457